MGKAITMVLNLSGVELAINYQESNRRVTTVSWVLPAQTTARIQIWNRGSLVYDRTIIGSNTGAENVPGNHTLVLYTDPQSGVQFYTLPPYLTYALNVESVGV